MMRLAAVLVVVGAALNLFSGWIRWHLGFVGFPYCDCCPQDSLHEDRCLRCTLFNLRTKAATPVRSEYLIVWLYFCRKKRLGFAGLR